MPISDRKLMLCAAAMIYVTAWSTTAEWVTISGLQQSTCWAITGVILEGVVSLPGERIPYNFGRVCGENWKERFESQEGEVMFQGTSNVVKGFQCLWVRLLEVLQEKQPKTIAEAQAILKSNFTVILESCQKDLK